MTDNGQTIGPSFNGSSDMLSTIQSPVTSSGTSYAEEGPEYAEYRAERKILQLLAAVGMPEKMRRSQLQRLREDLGTIHAGLEFVQMLAEDEWRYEEFLIAVGVNPWLRKAGVQKVRALMRLFVRDFGLERAAAQSLLANRPGITAYSEKELTQLVHDAVPEPNPEWIATFLVVCPLKLPKVVPSRFAPPEYATSSPLPAPTDPVIIFLYGLGYGLHQSEQFARRLRDHLGAGAADEQLIAYVQRYFDHGWTRYQVQQVLGRDPVYRVAGIEAVLGLQLLFERELGLERAVAVQTIALRAKLLEMGVEGCLRVIDAAIATRDPVHVKRFLADAARAYVRFSADELQHRREAWEAAGYDVKDDPSLLMRRPMVRAAPKPLPLPRPRTRRMEAPKREAPPAPPVIVEDEPTPEITPTPEDVEETAAEEPLFVDHEVVVETEEADEVPVTRITPLLPPAEESPEPEEIPVDDDLPEEPEGLTDDVSVNALIIAGWDTGMATRYVKRLPAVRTCPMDRLIKSSGIFRSHMGLTGKELSDRLLRNAEAICTRLSELRSYGHRAGQMKLRVWQPRASKREMAQFIKDAHLFNAGDFWDAVGILLTAGFLKGEAQEFIQKHPELLMDEARPLNLLRTFIRSSGQPVKEARDLLEREDERAVLFERPETFDFPKRILAARSVSMDLAFLRVRPEALDFTHGWSRLYLPHQELEWRLAYLSQAIKTRHSLHLRMISTRTPYEYGNKPERTPEVAQLLFLPTRGEFISGFRTSRL